MKAYSERSSAAEKQEKCTKVSVLGRIRRSFRRRRESYCVQCSAVTSSCEHSKSKRSRSRSKERRSEQGNNNYENVDFVNNKEDLLKWLDLDLSHGINNNSGAALRRRFKVERMTTVYWM